MEISNLKNVDTEMFDIYFKIFTGDYIKAYRAYAYEVCNRINPEEMKLLELKSSYLSIMKDLTSTNYIPAANDKYMTYLKYVDKYGDVLEGIMKISEIANKFLDGEVNSEYAKMFYELKGYIGFRLMLDLQYSKILNKKIMCILNNNVNVLPLNKERIIK